MTTKGILAFLAFMAFGLCGYAQNTKDPDSLFAQARTAAFDEKNYPSAIALARQALEITSTYTDVVIFLGRVYAWNNQADSARYYYDLALKQKPGYEDAVAAYADLELWNHNDSAALALVAQGLASNPASAQLLLRKARILESQRRYEAAAMLADSILVLDKDNEEARNMVVRLQDFRSRNRIGIKYDYAYFDKQFTDPWHLASLDYTRQTGIGSFTGRVNYANRFGNSGLQYELESYPRFSKTFYAYAAAAYSGSTNSVFPRWRVGASLFANLPRAFEAEAGMRYLYFAAAPSGTDFYTLYLGKYYKQFLFGARVYLTPDTAATSQSYNAMARYYFGGVDDYLHLLVGYGISPDDRQSVNLLLLKGSNLHTYRAELMLRKQFNGLNIVMLNLSLLNQEFVRGLEIMKGNQVLAGIGYIHRF